MIIEKLPVPPILAVLFATALFVSGIAFGARNLVAQQIVWRALTLSEARELAQRESADIRAAAEAVAVAQGREKQAHAYGNPAFTYGREQTSGHGLTNSQNIASVEQRIELGGLRISRIEAAALRTRAAEQRLTAAKLQVDFEASRSYALAVAADRRAVLAEQAAASFAEALKTSEQRLTAGDVSGYANRRLRLEAARYATTSAEAALARRSARVALVSLISQSTDAVVTIEMPLSDTLPDSMPALTPRVTGPGTVVNAQQQAAERDSLIRLALASRPDLRALDLDANAAFADARVTARERVPSPSFSLGLKNERVAGTSSSPGAPDGFTGFTAGFSLPLPIWDRRQGAIRAAGADARRRVAEKQSLANRIAREVAEAFDSYSALRIQLALLEPHLGGETSTAMRAVQVAYAEGEVTLVEWLDAVRAYHDAESSVASLRAEALIRRAALERAIGNLTKFFHD